MEALDTFRTNVAGISFSLGLNLCNTSYLTEGRDRLIESLFDEDLGPKIHTLHLASLRDAWATFFSDHLQQLTKLNDLRINGNGDIVSSDGFSLLEVTSLRKLSIANFKAPITPPSNTITTLDICNLPTTICAGLLTQCPNLIILCASQIRCACVGSHSLDRSPITLGRLEEFSLRHCDDSPCTMTLWHRIQTPSLKSFSWDTKYTKRGPTLPATLLDIPNSLTTLSLRNIGTWDNRGVEDVIKWLPSLEHIHFYGCPKSTVKRFLRVLGWSDDRHYLPALHTLTISDRYQPYTSHWADADAPYALCDVNGRDILRVVKRRLTEGVCTSFRFVLEGEYMMTVAGSIWKRLTKLVTHGFKLEVVSFGGVDLLALTQLDPLEEDVDKNESNDDDAEEQEQETDEEEEESLDHDPDGVEFDEDDYYYYEDY